MPRETRRARSDTVPDVQPTTVRFDDETRAAIAEQAKRRGLNSDSEYIRLAVLSQLAWDRALEAVRAGARVEDLADAERLLALLAEVSRKK